MILQAKPSTLLFEAANPRHAHDWATWRDAKIPDDKVLVPGVLDSTTNYIEHPELVAQRILTYADIVGPDRVMGGTDCGFGTWAGFGAIDPDICWAKMQSLSEGARIASERAARARGRNTTNPAFQARRVVLATAYGVQHGSLRRSRPVCRVNHPDPAGEGAHYTTIAPSAWGVS